MGIAVPPGARRSTLRLRSSARRAHVGPLQQEIRRLYSINWKLLFNKIEHFSDRFLPVVFARESPAIPIALLQPRQTSYCAPTPCRNSPEMPSGRCRSTFSRAISATDRDPQPRLEESSPAPVSASPSSTSIKGDSAGTSFVPPPPEGVEVGVTI